jgi:hypothetical protein
MTMREQLTAPGALLRFVGALILVYSTFNPEGVSYYHWALQPLVRGTIGFTALKAVAGIVLFIGWIMFVQAARRSLGLKGVLLALALFAALVWLLAEWRVLSLSSTRVVGHVALVVVALLLAVGMSWSHVTRRLTGQVDTDEVE